MYKLYFVDVIKLKMQISDIYIFFVFLIKIKEPHFTVNQNSNRPLRLTQFNTKLCFLANLEEPVGSAGGPLEPP